MPDEEDGEERAVEWLPETVALAYWPEATCMVLGGLMCLWGFLWPGHNIILIGGGAVVFTMAVCWVGVSDEG